ncbi:MAG: methyl-accepting chemotaxis protein [Deltaproteobacteria bacterium]|nr:MAG: methyl-accepting chemotaxis protein [Deltaproteobacteria bacterium]
MEIGILKRLQLGMMVFGIAMGLIFPLYAMFFVEFKEGMQIWFNLGCIIAGIVVGGFSFLLVKIILLKHLRKLAWACREVTAGHLDVDIDVKSPDEIGEIVSGFNMMTSTLDEMFNEVKSGVKNLVGVAGNLSAFSHELVETIGEQRGHVTNISAATSEATATINEISENLSMTVGFSRGINENANQTNDQINRSVEAMSQSSDSMNRTVQLMEHLSIQSKDITSILMIIGEIAQQTNLLSLNATVEAARAGKHGRGFAVVAGEVKELASRTAKATQEIEDMVETFQESVDEIIKGVRVNSDLSTTLDNMLNSSTKNVDEIMQSIQKVSLMIAQVSEATKQQVDAYHNIDDSMGSISQAFYEMLESTDDLVQNGDDILKFTSHLQSIIRKFDKNDHLQLAA